jgi:hypothetical protein
MPRDNIPLDGAEVSILKGIGFGGGDTDGATLIDRCGDLEIAELMDSLKGLISMGYVECDSYTLQSQEDLEKAHFHVNSGYSKELKGSMDPKEEPKKSKRVRRE